MKVVFIGDVVGRPGRKALKMWLPRIREEYSPHMVIANGENAAGGFGLTKEVANELLDLGIDVLTTGNHVWDKKEFVKDIELFPQILRPLNYPEGVPGKGWLVKNIDGTDVAVLNAAGRIFMECLDCPFRKTDEALKQINAKIKIVDFHAETTAEKKLYAFYFTQRVSAVLGTHTHVQTCDEQIIDGYTGFISDAGMTGPINSSIGMDYKEALTRIVLHLPQKFKVAKGPVMLNGVYMEFDREDGKCLKIERIWFSEE